jgi:glycosyltransferase involved in cell wall biosynthesis
VSAPRPLRALFCVNSEDDGGAARSVALLVGELDRTRVEPYVVVHREGALSQRLRALGVGLEVVPELVETPTRPRPGAGAAGAALRNAADLARAVVKLRALARAQEADLLYGHTTWSNLCCAAAGAGRTPVVWHIRNDHSPRAVRAAMLAVVRTTAVRLVIAVSRSAAQPYRSLGERVQVVPTGVALPAAGRPAPVLRRQLGRGLPEDAILVGAAGRLVPHKGLDVLAQAARLCRARAPALPLRFVILGKSPRHADRDLLGELRAAMPADTVFTGYVPDPERYLGDLDLVVVPSIYPDPFPRVIIESLALGVPVVASRIGGIPEAVRDGREGFLVPPGDGAALAERILALADNPVLRRAMGARGAERARACYSAAGCARAVEALLWRYCAREAATGGDANHRYSEMAQ